MQKTVITEKIAFFLSLLFPIRELRKKSLYYFPCPCLFKSGFQFKSIIMFLIIIIGIRKNWRVQCNQACFLPSSVIFSMNRLSFNLKSQFVLAFWMLHIYLCNKQHDAFVAQARCLVLSTNTQFTPINPDDNNNTVKSSAHKFSLRALKASLPFTCILEENSLNKLYTVTRSEQHITQFPMSPEITLYISYKHKSIIDILRKSYKKPSASAYNFAFVAAALIFPLGADFKPLLLCSIFFSAHISLHSLW